MFGCLVKYYVINGIFCVVFKCGTMFNNPFFHDDSVVEYLFSLVYVSLGIRFG